LPVLATTPYWQRLLVLVPVFVVGIGMILAVLILLSRAFAQFVRESEHKNWIYFSCAIVVAAVVILTYLGIKLPKEG
jgi:threonine/homoserine/homoserine lactone efflux protein